MYTHTHKYMCVHIYTNGLSCMHVCVCVSIMDMDVPCTHECKTNDSSWYTRIHTHTHTNLRIKKKLNISPMCVCFYVCLYYVCMLRMYMACPNECKHISYYVYVCSVFMRLSVHLSYVCICVDTHTCKAHVHIWKRLAQTQKYQKRSPVSRMCVYTYIPADIHEPPQHTHTHKLMRIACVWRNIWMNEPQQHTHTHTDAHSLTDSCALHVCEETYEWVRTLCTRYTCTCRAHGNLYVRLCRCASVCVCVCVRASERSCVK